MATELEKLQLARCVGSVFRVFASRKDLRGDDCVKERHFKWLKQHKQNSVGSCMSYGRELALVLLCVALSACTSHTTKAPDPVALQRSAALSRIADATHQSGFNGIVLVADAQQVLLERAYGRLSPLSDEPLRVDSVFRLASITKKVTAILVMQEVSAGRLKLDERLGAYWPDFPNADARAATLRQLLMHTSGLPNPDDVDGFYDVKNAARDHMRTAAQSVCAQPLRQKPGEKFEYNNCDYLVLGALLEKLTGTDYETLVRTRVFGPSGMTNAGVYSRDAGLVARHTQGVVDGKSDGVVNPAAYGAAGGLFGMVRDVWQLNRAFAAGRLLDEPAKDAMTQPNQWGAALGVWSYTLKTPAGRLARIVERQGWIGGIRVVNLLDLNSHTTVVIMSTQGDYDLSQSWSGKGIAAELILQAVSGASAGIRSP